MIALICTRCGSDWPSFHDSLSAIGLIVGVAAVIGILVYAVFIR